MKACLFLDLSWLVSSSGNSHGDPEDMPILFNQKNGIEIFLDFLLFIGLAYRFIWAWFILGRKFGRVNYSSTLPPNSWRPNWLGLCNICDWFVQMEFASSSKSLGYCSHFGIFEPFQANEISYWSISLLFLNSFSQAISSLMALRICQIYLTKKIRWKIV